MNIKISLDTQSIENAISRLTIRQMHLEEDTEQLVDILTNEGAEVAQSAYGDFGVAATPMSEGTQGTIFVYGDMPLIAEFGAGDATVDPKALFEHAPFTDVFPGSYSLEEGTKEYWKWGSWHFGGELYKEVQPRLGLAQAKMHIMNTAVETAMEVMHYD